MKQHMYAVVSLGVGAVCLSVKVTGRKHYVCTVRRDTHAALPEIKQPAELWESKDAERRDTWPAVNKEHPLRTTQPPADAHKLSRAKDTVIQEHTTQRYNIYSPSDNTCAQMDVYIPAQNTQTRIVIPSLRDTQMNKQTKTTNKQTAD